MYHCDNIINDVTKAEQNNWLSYERSKNYQKWRFINKTVPLKWKIIFKVRKIAFEIAVRII